MLVNPLIVATSDVDFFRSLSGEQNRLSAEVEGTKRLVGLSERSAYDTLEELEPEGGSDRR